MALELKNINYKTGSFALKDISLQVSGKEYFVFLGPTGSGKTLILKTIAGLVAPASGGVFLDGRDITRLPPEDRGFGYVAQDYRLFRHLSVKGNIEFSPRLRILAPTERAKISGELSSALGIEKLLGRKAVNLSGGERQRIAVARALASRPRMVLLDEPFSAVDEGLKKHLWFEIKSALAASRVPVAHVTHDIEEAVTLADRIAVVIDGKIRQTGTPAEILLRPSSGAVARYLGIKNIFAGRIISSDSGALLMECSGQKISAPLSACPAAPPETGTSASVCVRPQSVKIIRPGEPVRAELKDNLFEGEIERAYFFSEAVSVFVRCDALEWEARFPHAVWHRNSLAVGKRISVALWRPDIMVYPDTLLK